MQEKKSHNANLIIDKLKFHLKLTTDVELSDLLNVKPNTISTWKKRNSLDFNLIVAICEQYKLDLNELFFDKSFSPSASSENLTFTPLISREFQYQYCIGNSLELNDLPKYHFPFIKSNESRAFQVTSLNMLPSIEENSYVVCQSTTIEEIADNSIVVVVSKEKGLFINRIEKLENAGNEYLLKNENPFFKDFTIKRTDIDELWIVISVLSFNLNNQVFFK